MINDFDNTWDRYMGRDVAPREYAADGWDAARIRRDLLELWGETLTPAELQRVTDMLTMGLQRMIGTWDAPWADVRELRGGRP